MKQKTIVIISIGILVLIALVFLRRLSHKTMNRRGNGLNYKILPSGIWADVQPFIDQHSYTPYHRKALVQFYLEFENELLHPEICLKNKWAC